MRSKYRSSCTRRLGFETCESRLCLSAIGFTSHTVIETDVSYPTFVASGDIDGDGDRDVAFAGSGSLGWFENTNGLGDFGPPRVAANNSIPVTALSLVDVDGDGDLDVFTATFRSANRWYENLDGGDDFAPSRAFAAGRAPLLADLDNDGDVDYVASDINSGTIFWQTNLDGKGDFGPRRLFDTSRSCCELLAVGDLDGDGDLDLLGASDETGIHWFENVDDGLDLVKRQQISGQERFASIFAEDMDGDGDLDILAGNDYRQDQVVWFENTDGLGRFARERLITQELDEADRIRPADVDGDGDVDVVTTRYRFAQENIAWFENSGDASDFAEHIITTDVSFVHSMALGDLNGDGGVDLLAADSEAYKIGCFLNKRITSSELMSMAMVNSISSPLGFRLPWAT